MANNNDGSGKKDPKSGAKPAGGGQEQRKPTAIIDLKATEVKDKPGAKPTAQNKPDAKSAAPDKPGDKQAAAKGAEKPGSTDAGKTKPSTSVPPVSELKKPDQPAGSQSDKSAKPDAGDGSKSDKKSDGGKAAGATTPKDEPAPQPVGNAPAKSSGGGVWSMFTHLAAGIAGGALVLFAAQPIERETGIEFLPRAELPAEFGQRLAALEGGSAANAEFGKLSDRINAAETRLGEIDQLRQQLEGLASAPANEGGNDTAKAEAGTPDAALEKRLAQLERTLETLASSTGSDGGRTNVARLAAISGKVADIETSLNNQISALRESVTKELEARVANTAEASAAAAAGTKRLDRELATVKTGAARLEQRAATLKAGQDSLSEAVRVAREETAKLRVDLDGLKGDVARPQDVATALAPLTGKMSAMETRLKDVVENETTRKANAQRIVMALELGNLKRTLDRGGPYAAELSEVRRVTGGSVDLSALERFQATGVPTTAQLRDEFAKLAYSVIRASETKTDGTVFDRLVSGARSLVKVRRADLPASDNSTEATVARIDRQLQQGNLTGALEEAKKLPEVSAKPAKPWLERVAARANIDRAISALENQLKSSLGSAAGTKG